MGMGALSLLGWLELKLVADLGLAVDARFLVACECHRKRKLLSKRLEMWFSCLTLVA
jgi:hypothetical protein